MQPSCRHVDPGLFQKFQIYKLQTQIKQCQQNLDKLQRKPPRVYSLPQEPCSGDNVLSLKFQLQQLKLQEHELAFEREQLLNDVCIQLRNWGIRTPFSSNDLNLNKALLFISTLAPNDVDDEQVAIWTEKIIELDGDVNARDENGVTPLMFAIKNKRMNQLEVLRKYGAKMEQCDKNNKNAWHYIALYDKGSLMKTLMEDPNACGIDQQDINGCTPLKLAFKRDFAVAELFLRHGARTDIQDKKGCNAWIQAVKAAIKANDPDVIALLGYYDKSQTAINCKNKEGKTALDISEENLSPKLTMLLLRYGAISPHPTIADYYENVHKIEKEFSNKFAQLKNHYLKENDTVLSALQQQCGQPQENNRYRHYGGDAGNEYFQTYINKVVRPTLTGFFLHIREVFPTLDCDVQEVLTPMVLDIVLNNLGEIRGDITWNNQSSDAKTRRQVLHGLRLFYWRILDAVHIYPSWRSHVIHEAKQAMKEALKKCPQPTFANLAKELEIEGRENARAEDVFHITIKLPQSDDPLVGQFILSIWIDNKTFNDFEKWDEKTIDAIFNVEETNSDLKGDIDIACNREIFTSARHTSIAQNLIEAICTNDVESLREYQFNILRHMHLSSFYKRSLMSIVELMLLGLADMHDCDLEYQGDWQPHSERKNLTIDMRSLSAFNGADQFFDEFRQAVKLVPRSRGDGLKA